MGKDASDFANDRYFKGSSNITAIVSLRPTKGDYDSNITTTLKVTQINTQLRKTLT